MRYERHAELQISGNMSSVCKSFAAAVGGLGDDHHRTASDIRCALTSLRYIDVFTPAGFLGKREGGSEKNSIHRGSIA